jgi:hypothetical protein
VFDLAVAAEQLLLLCKDKSCEPLCLENEDQQQQRASRASQEVCHSYLKIRDRKPINLSCCLWFPRSLRLPPIDPFQQHRQLRSRECDGTAGGLRPDEAPTLQPLLERHSPSPSHHSNLIRSPNTTTSCIPIEVSRDRVSIASVAWKASAAYPSERAELQAGVLR